MKHQPTHCKECNIKSESIRLGLCSKCYQRQYNARYVGTVCECCGHTDTRALGRRRLNCEDWTTLCGNCLLISGKRKMTLEQLKGEVYPEGDRRQPNRRTGASRRGAPRREMDLGALDGAEKRSTDRRVG